MKSQIAPTDPEGWTTISSKTQFQDSHLTVVTQEVRSPNGLRTQRWTVVYRKAAVIIAPMTADGKLVLIRQERVAIRAAIWEVPAGQVDDPREAKLSTLEAVARREVREETGYELSARGEIIYLGQFFSSPGFTNEQGHFFLARPVERGAVGPAHSESESILECRAFEPAEVARMIARGAISDANTLGICAHLVVRGILSLHA